MRLILAIVASITFLFAKAQTHLPISQLGYGQWVPSPDHPLLADSNSSDHKWQLTHYAGFTAGAIFWAGSTSFISVPAGLQLSRPLNKNLYGFAGVSVAPVFFSFNRLYTQPVLNLSYPGHNLPMGNGFGLNSGVEAGLMYINDAKTFSISSSIGVDRTSYPAYPTNRTPTKKP
ncbi:MAG TPA: hypothetical protein VK563_10370 [Puia sp.]|nr:hypothetical protein [Puia sp.]